MLKQLKRKKPFLSTNKCTTQHQLTISEVAVSNRHFCWILLPANVNLQKDY